MIMTAADLLSRETDPDEAAIRRAIEGNLCRCTGYHNIVRSIQAGATAMRERATDAGGAEAGQP
jgi:carbon-monoxide dehydrogenase small subunit